METHITKRWLLVSFTRNTWRVTWNILMIPKNSPVIILCGWMGSKHQRTNSIWNSSSFTGMLVDMVKAALRPWKRNKFRNPSVSPSWKEDIYPLMLHIFLCHALVSDLFHVLNRWTLLNLCMVTPGNQYPMPALKPYFALQLNVTKRGFCVAHQDTHHAGHCGRV